MALLFIDGFDTLVTADLGLKYEYTYNTPVVGSSYKRNGTNGLQCGYLDTVRKTVAPATTTTGVFGFALYIATAANGDICVVGNSEGDQFRLRLASSDMTLTLNDRYGNVLASSSGITLSEGEWNYLEIKFSIANSGGTVQVRLNAASTYCINFTGDTHYQTTVDWTTVALSNGAAMGMLWYDDFYICDLSDASTGNTGPSNDNFLGDMRVVAVLPQTDAVDAGSNADWSVSTSTDHGAVVDDADADTDETDYVYSSTQNQVDTYNFPALGVTGTVYGVQLSLCSKKTDAGAREIAAVARPATTNRVGATKTLSTSYTYYLQVWNYNPETDDDWTVSVIDASEFGIKVVT